MPISRILDDEESVLGSDSEDELPCVPEVFPVDALAPDVKELFRHLECPVCLDLQADMSIVCRAGHSMCAVCHAQMLRFADCNCPTCKQPFITPRNNLAVNGLVQALGLKPRQAPQPVAAAVEVAVEVAVAAAVVPPAPPVAPGAPGIVAVRGRVPPSRRSLLAKLKIRIRQYASLHRALTHGRIIRGLYENRKNTITSQVKQFGQQWRVAELGGNIRLIFPEELEIAFHSGYSGE